MDLKSTFESLKGKATDLAQAGVAQSKRLGEIAKLKANNMAEEDAIKKAYLEIGKLYYAEHGVAPRGCLCRCLREDYRFQGPDRDQQRAHRRSEAAWRP